MRRRDTCLAFEPCSGELLVFGTEEGFVGLISVSAGSEEAVHVWGPEQIAQDRVAVLRWSAQGDRLAIGSGDRDKRVYLYHREACVLRATWSLPGLSGPVAGVQFCLAGSFILAASGDGEVAIWDTATA